MASFRKHENGTWEYRIRYRDPISGVYKEKSKRGFKKKKEAELAAQEMERKLAEGFEQTDTSLAEYLKTWLNEYKKGTVRKNTYRLHESNINNHIIPYFKSLLLTDLKPIIYQKFLNHLSAQGYSRRTVEIIHSTMTDALQKAVILRKIDKNPCTGATIKGDKTNNSIQYIESKDIPTFLQQAYKYGYIYWIFFKTLIETGMRKGEAAALQWSDIDLKARTISISKSLDFTAKTKDDLFGDTKTFNSKRQITISQALANDLKLHVKYQNQNKTELNDIYHHDLNLVFCRKDGNFLPKSSLFNAFRKILKRSNLPLLPIHSLRHTHAVLLLESGADMKYVQERLGHGSMRVTADIYAHISRKIDQTSMDRFEEYTKGMLK